MLTLIKDCEKSKIVRYRIAVRIFEFHVDETSEKDNRDEEQIPDYAGLTKPWFGTTANRPPRVVMLTRPGLDGLIEAVIAGGLDIPHKSTLRALVGATSSLPAEGNRPKGRFSPYGGLHLTSDNVYLGWIRTVELQSKDVTSTWPDGPRNNVLAIFNNSSVAAPLAVARPNTPAPPNTVWFRSNQFAVPAFVDVHASKDLAPAKKIRVFVGRTVADLRKQQKEWFKYRNLVESAYEEFKQKAMEKVADEGWNGEDDKVYWSDDGEYNPIFKVTTSELMRKEQEWMQSGEDSPTPWTAAEQLELENAVLQYKMNRRKWIVSYFSKCEKRPELARPLPDDVLAQSNVDVISVGAVASSNAGLQDEVERLRRLHTATGIKYTKYKAIVCTLNADHAELSACDAGGIGSKEQNP